VYKSSGATTCKLHRSHLLNLTIWISNVDHTDHTDPCVCQYCVTCICSLSLKCLICELHRKIIQNCETVTFHFKVCPQHMCAATDKKRLTHDNLDIKVELMSDFKNTSAMWRHSLLKIYQKLPNTGILCSGLYGITSQKTVFVIVTAVGISNLTKFQSQTWIFLTYQFYHPSAVSMVFGLSLLVRSIYWLLYWDLSFLC